MSSKSWAFKSSLFENIVSIRACDSCELIVVCFLEHYKGCVLTLHGVALAIFGGPVSALQRPRQARPMG